MAAAARLIFNTRLGPLLLIVYAVAHAGIVVGAAGELPWTFAISILLAVALGLLIDFSRGKDYRLGYHFRIRGMQFAILRAGVLAWALYGIAGLPAALVGMWGVGMLAGRVAVEYSLSKGRRVFATSLAKPSGARPDAVLRADTYADRLRRAAANKKKASARWLRQQSGRARAMFHTVWLGGDLVIGVAGAAAVLGVSFTLELTGAIAMAGVGLCVAIAVKANAIASLAARHAVAYSDITARWAACAPTTSIATANALYFASGPRALYQLMPWVKVFERLSDGVPTSLVVRSIDSFNVLRRTTNLPVIYVRTFSDMQMLVEKSPDLGVLFYVNHDRLNYQPLRFGNVLHIHIGHGESDKSYMASNQSRAYDLVFVAGQAAVDRHTRHLIDFDVSRLKEIGRPESDVAPDPGSIPTSVMYAPTYEGDIPGMRYTSVDVFGLEMVSSLIESGFTVVYRPHPFTGRSDHAVKEADARIKSLIRELGPPHWVDTSRPAHVALKDSAVLISDVSAMAIDFLATGRPLWVTDPGHVHAADVGESATRNAAYQVDESNYAEIGQVITETLEKDPLAAERARWADYYFGDVTPGASLKRFQFEVEQAHATRAAEIASRKSAGSKTSPGPV